MLARHPSTSWTAPERRIPDRLAILCVSPLPPSPPRFGAQARMHGLLTHLARHHAITAISLIDDGFDTEECRRAMSEYCWDVVLVPNPNGRHDTANRILQLRSVTSARSFQRLLYSVAPLQSALDGVLQRKRFDVVNLEFPYLAHL